MLCPYDKIELAADELRAHEVFGCKSCGGQWVPSDQFKSLEFETGFRLNSYIQKLRENQVPSLGLSCPSGCGVMQTAELKSLRLDWCEQCNGIWFDEKELDILFDQYKGNGVAEEAVGWLEALLEVVFLRP